MWFVLETAGLGITRLATSLKGLSSEACRFQTQLKGVNGWFIHSPLRRLVVRYCTTVNFAEGDRVCPLTRSRIRIANSYSPAVSELESISLANVRR